jgi:4-amino-4-deoxy-L-arabinose transferase-like glycosyltransferase
MLSFIKKYWQEVCVTALAAGFFAAAAFFVCANFTSDLPKWNSPDEASNYFFTRYYVENGELSYFEKTNVAGGDIVVTRSMRSDNAMVKPVSFLGIILIYGFLAKIFSLSILPYLTPFFAGLGIFFFYLFLRKIFNRDIAFFSCFMLAGFPPYFYYSVRGFFHNILFVVLLIIGLYFMLVKKKKEQMSTTVIPANDDLFAGGRGFRKFFSVIDWRNILFPSLSGFFIGLAVLTRASEVLWLAPALFIIWIFNIKKFNFLQLLLFLSFAFVAFSPQIYWNEILYGGFFHGGYAEINQSISSIAQNSSSVIKEVSHGNFSIIAEFLKKIKTNVFYFGFNPAKSRLVFENYFIKMFPWLFWPAFCGLIVFLVRFFSWKKRHWVYLFSFLTIAIILIFYYGSWDFHDNPDPKSVTIGNSYTRYWLPVYLGLMPLAASFILRLTWAIFPNNNELLSSGESTEGWRGGIIGNCKNSFLINAARAVLLIIYFHVSANFLFAGSEEGLVYFSVNRETALREYQETLWLTEENSIIITRYHDKLFFPARRVAFGDLSNKELNNHYAQVVKFYPVYYFNFNLYDFALVDLNKKLSESGLILKKVEKVNSAFALYKLYLIE